MKLLKQLYTIHSKSGKEDKIRRFIIKYVKRKIKDAKIVKDLRGNIYITRGISETYPVIVAHMDQVQTLHSGDFQAVEANGIIFGYSQKHKRFEGLGADDKNGIWIALKCLQKYDNIKVAFFVEEEIGCNGSENADMNFFKDARFVIQPDRRGNDDLITSICGLELCSKEFIMAVNAKKFGYSEEDGMMTDIETLKNNGLEVSAINLSCGYYRPHSDEEFTIIADLENCLHLVQSIIENCTDTYHHVAVNNFYDYYDDFYYLYDEMYEFIMQNPGATYADFEESYKAFLSPLEKTMLRREFEQVKYDVQFFEEDDKKDQGKAV